MYSGLILAQSYASDVYVYVYVITEKLYKNRTEQETGAKLFPWLEILEASTVLNF
jgi:hypothetical protein